CAREDDDSFDYW
nr:immunoglobulin heavy chain junction region [Mus musculus]MBK4187409.1 immunoglobulin heavy chain junction region [Mus musculus]